MGKEKDPKSLDYPFTVDSDETQEMPSIGRLLNRKSLEISKYSTETVDLTQSKILIAPAASSSGASATNAASQTAQSTESAQSPRVQPATRRRERRARQRIPNWDAQTLRASSDSLSHALARLIDTQTPASPVRSSLLLAACFEHGRQTPVFEARAAHAQREHLILWSGLRWSPEGSPDLWNSLVENGFIEIPPQEINSIRTAFGVELTEWITLAQLGPTHACRGIVLILSIESLRKAVLEALPALTGSTPVAA